uniref:Anamorsin n=1 Tax=Piliocolobus tephrosceles TaxID=591936 RepID=A0A8C9GRL6_9PRIM
MINFTDALIILNDDEPCKILRKKYYQLFVPTISVFNFLKKKIYKKYNNIFLYSYKNHSFFWDLNDNFLLKIFKCLNRNGVLRLIIYIDDEDYNNYDGNSTLGKNNISKVTKERGKENGQHGNDILKKLKKECLYNGFINISDETTVAENGVIINITAEYPDFELDDDHDGSVSSDEEIHESQEDKKKVVNRVCDNCTCGRKEKQNSLEKKILNDNEVEYVTENVTSSCGNCYLGDAFRCSSCPYKGLPAFQPGENVKLNLNNEHEIN